MDFGAFLQHLSVSELVVHVSMERVQHIQRQRWRNGWQMVTAGREIRWYRRQIPLRPHVQNQIHADQYVEQEVTMEQPVSYKENRCVDFYDINPSCTHSFFLPLIYTLGFLGPHLCIVTSVKLDILQLTFFFQLKRID